ncbi:MAG: oxidoreductase [Dehalococcoidia bacterium]|nr:oxidoreductase [Dehalococcoidia bacterium]
MWQLDSHLSEIIRRTPSVKSFRFPVWNEALAYEAGQYFFLTIKVDGNDAVHHFSFSSSPTEKGYIEFTKHITGSDFSRALDTMQPGAWVRLKGPMGAFTLPSEPRRLAFVSGGIGITPLRSMLRYICDSHLIYDVVLLYSSPSYEEIVFRDELDMISRTYPNIRLEYLLTGRSPPGWMGKSGLMSSEIIRELITDYIARLFYISGPPGMVASLTDQLRTLEIPDDHIKRDSFTGYD